VESAFDTGSIIIAKVTDVLDHVSDLLA